MAASAEMVHESPLCLRGGPAGRMVGGGRDGARPLVTGANLHGERPLSRRRKQRLRRQPLGDSILAAQADQSRSCNHHGIVVRLADLT